MRIVLILILLVATGCTVQQHRRETVLDKLKELYPNAWQQMLVEFDLLKRQQADFWSDEEILARLLVKYPPRKQIDSNVQTETKGSTSPSP
ncbi:MAG: hypothetical protein JXA82_07510 [Sedimentisphaerales bacterium]|nr:hypothetical protein [Sedimentisphaerales bacterium]